MSYPTLSDLKTYLDVSSASDDALLTQILDAVVSYVEVATDRHFVAKTNQVWRVPRYHITPTYIVVGTDIRAIPASATLTGDDGGTITAADMVLPAVPSRVVYVDTGALSVKHYATLSGVTTGYTATCPEDLRLAIMRLAGHWYRARDIARQIVGIQEEGVLTLGGAVPAEVQQVLKQYAWVEVMRI